MDTSRFFTLSLLVGLGALCATPRLSASGGWFDEGPPTTLSDDLDRLPAKTLGEILLETVEKGKFEIAEIVENDAVSDDDLKAVVDKIGKAKPEELAAEIDKLVAKARLQYVLKGGVLNTLYDLRDAVTAKGPTDEQRKKYCEDRLEKGLKAVEGAKPDTYAEGDAMRASLLYAQGAVAFNAGEKETARPWFEEIVAKFPDQPRAESALFLVARCAFSKARSFDDAGDDKKPQKQKNWDEAIGLFRDYLKKYPQGRYVADVHGWLGALLWEDHPAEALEHYIAQLEDPAHPECRKSAAHMVERVLGKVVAHPDENAAVLKVVAQHPRVAQAAVYLVLNAPEIDPFDGKYDEPADLRKWKVSVLPKLASLVSAEEKRYQGDWALRLRAMLAQAASGVGKQEEALQLTDVSEEDLKKSDDLLFARILVLQRMKKPKEVAKIGKLFFDTFEDSQLKTGVALRLAQALVDDHRAGEAYVFLVKAAPAGEGRYSKGDDGVYPENEVDLDLKASGLYPDTDGSDGFWELRSTILGFAPLKELEAVQGDKIWEEKGEALVTLEDALRVRKAALEDYAGALKLGGDDPFKQQMEDFAELAKKIKNANGKAKAEAMIALGDAYAEAADKAPPPVDEGARGRDNLTRRDDARTLGFANPDDELENSNLMRHATRWWLRAARTVPGTPTSAKARAKVLDGIEVIARGSDYDFTRAMESNMAQASKEIYDVLQKESPKSAEARDAAYWDFIPCPKPKPKEKKKDDPNADNAEPEEAWALRGLEDPGREEDALSLLGGYHALHYNAFGEFALANDSAYDTPEGIAAIEKEVTDKAANPLELHRQFTEEYVKDRFNKVHQTAASSEQMKLANLFEDLMLFYQVKGVSDKARNEYIALRLRVGRGTGDYGMVWDQNEEKRPKIEDVLKHARENPELAPAMDFVDYLQIYVNQADRGSSHDDFSYPTYSEVETACREFLKKYPKSPKRQAASLVLIRSLFRQLPDRFGHEGPGERHQHKMDDSRPVVELNEPFKPTALEKAIAAYEKEFPKPRYAAEMRNYKGIVAWRKFDYGAALELTIAQLNDENHQDLQMEAAVRLANIYADLRDEKHRIAVLAALKTRPAAVEKLKQYLDVAPQNAGHPLRCMRKFLEDRLGF